MKTANLTGPLLDYWTARAEGVPAADLELRGVARTDNHICVKHLRGFIGGTSALMVLDYSTNWALAGQLIEKHSVDVVEHYKSGDPVGWRASTSRFVAFGSHPREAVCRAVVYDAFGAEVEDLSC